MNCEEFKHNLQAFLDGEVPMASAREHLARCSECQSALAREQRTAASIRSALEDSAASLSLSSQDRREILQRLQPKPGLWAIWLRAWRSVISAPLRPLGAAAAFVIVLFLAFETERSSRHGSSGPPVRGGHELLVIEVPIHTETHVFQRQNSMVVDTIASGMSVARARLVMKTETSKSL